VHHRLLDDQHPGYEKILLPKGIHYLWAAMQKAIQNITVVYLASIMLLRMMAMPISLLNYSMNKQFISRNLCENRFRTGSVCSGKCFLNKELAKANDNPTSNDSKGSIKILLIDFYENLEQANLDPGSSLNHSVSAFSLYPLISRSQEAIFHPPIV